MEPLKVAIMCFKAQRWWIYERNYKKKNEIAGWILGIIVGICTIAALLH